MCGVSGDLVGTCGRCVEELSARLGARLHSATFNWKVPGQVAVCSREEGRQEDGGEGSLN